MLQEAIAYARKCAKITTIPKLNMELNIFGALKHRLLTHYQFFVIAIFKCLNVLEWHRLMARAKC